MRQWSVRAIVPCVYSRRFAGGMLQAGVFTRRQVSAKWCHSRGEHISTIVKTERGECIRFALPEYALSFHARLAE